ncbi:MAG: putative Ig domain-containing protein [Rubrivivax sp.]
MLAFAPLPARWLLCALAAAFALGACGGGGGEPAPGVVVKRAPQVTSAPVTTASVGVPYVYEAKASDAEGDAWSLTQAPAGMSIDAASGLVTWTPAATQAGNQAVVLRVVDPAGLAATQSFSIAVTAANAAPRITNTPPATAVVGALYRHPVEASDPDGDALAYTLDAGPTASRSTARAVSSPGHRAPTSWAATPSRCAWPTRAGCRRRSRSR